MQKTILSWKYFNESAKVSYFNNFSLKNFSSFNFMSEIFNCFKSLLSFINIVSHNINNSVIVNINISSCLFNNSVYNLAARANNTSYFTRIYFKSQNTRRMRRKLWFRNSNCFSHIIQDKQASLLCLLENFFKDFQRNSIYFNIHLAGCYPLLCPGNLAIHISVMIFRTLNIC